MKRLLPLPLLIVAFLLLAAGLATAAGPEIEPFSTTGYTTNLVPAPPIPGFPPLIPSEFQFLPSGQVKFHIAAQGGPAVDDDLFCTALYGAPCQAVCFGFTGQACGTGGYFAGGSFQFDEWGVVDPATFGGANFGKLKITTGQGQADLRFSGQAIPTLSGPVAQGSFLVEKGTGAYKHDKKEEGTYSGGAGFVFTVDYAPLAFTPCPGGICPDRCAVFGAAEPKLKKDDLKWKIENEGETALTVSRITVNWPEANGSITKVKLGSKTLYDQPLGSSSVITGVLGLFTVIDGGWLGAEADRQIGADKHADLQLEFANKEISEEASDYTLVVEFAEGCAVPFAAFPPPAP